MSTPPRSVLKSRLLLALPIVGVLFIACNLRPSITAVGPLVDLMRHALGVSNATIGLLTTLPLLMFALVSPVAPLLSRRLGTPLALWCAMVVLLAGILLRSAGATLPLFAGTAVIGVSIAIGNVLLPSVVKQDFPARVGLMTSAYTTAMGAAAAIGSGLSLPLATRSGMDFGWRGSLAVWALLAAVASAVWLPQLRRRQSANERPAAVMQAPGTLVWTSVLAWKITLFMGLQSFFFYCSIAWLAQILIHDGMHALAAGWMLSLMQFVGLPATFAAPILATRLRDQRWLVAGISCFYVAGTLILLFCGGGPWLIVATVLIGIGQGSNISLALALFSLRTASAATAAELSGMAQSVGYLLAAAGPILLGVLYDSTGRWTASLLVLLAIALLMTASGLGAARDVTLS